MPGRGIFLTGGTGYMGSRFGLVTLDQVLATLVHTVGNPPDSERIFTVPDIRGFRL